MPSFPEEFTEPRAPVSRIIPGLIIIALLSVPVVMLSSAGDTDSRIPLFASVAIIVYIMTLFDIRIGLVLTMAAIGLAPEFEAGGVADLRVEDFLIPVLLFSWITRRETSRPVHLRGPLLLYLAASFIASIYGVVVESTTRRI